MINIVVMMLMMLKQTLKITRIPVALDDERTFSSHWMRNIPGEDVVEPRSAPEKGGKRRRRIVI